MICSQTCSGQLSAPAKQSQERETYKQRLRIEMNGSQYLAEKKNIGSENEALSLAHSSVMDIKKLSSSTTETRCSRLQELQWRSEVQSSHGKIKNRPRRETTIPRIELQSFPGLLLGCPPWTTHVSGPTQWE